MNRFHRGEFKVTLKGDVVIGVVFLGKFIWNPCGETVVSADDPLVVEMLDDPAEESTLESDSEPEETIPLPAPRTGVVLTGSCLAPWPKPSKPVDGVLARLMGNPGWAWAGEATA